MNLSLFALTICPTTVYLATLGVAILYTGGPNVKNYIMLDFLSMSKMKITKKKKKRLPIETQTR